MSVCIPRTAVAALLLSLVSSVLANDVLKALPADSWYRVPNSKLRPLCPSEAQFPGVRGGSGCAMVMEAWSGGAYDSAGKRLWVWGGGHGDYSGNELYAFGLEKLTWTRVTDPSPITTLSADPMPDGSPVSRHTYDGLAFISHAGRFFGYGGSMAGNGYGTQVTWTFDPAGKQWRNMDPAGPANRPATNCCNFNGEYDPATRKVYLRDPNWLCAYDYDKNIWSHVRSWEHGWGPGKGVIDTKRRLLFTTGSKEFLVYDIAGDKDVSADWQTRGGDSLIDGYGAGAAYDSQTDRLVGWLGGGVFALNMQTKVWTRMNAQGAPPKQLSNGTYGRFRYVPEDNVFILVNGIDEDVFFYKLSSGGGSTLAAKAKAVRSVRPLIELRADRVRFQRPGMEADRGGPGWDAEGRKGATRE
jgi:hypothetical protein